MVRRAGRGGCARPQGPGRDRVTRSHAAARRSDRPARRGGRHARTVGRPADRADRSVTGGRSLVVLALGLLLSTPSIVAFTAGNQAVSALATHMLFAIAAAWVGVALVSSVVRGYSNAA